MVRASGAQRGAAGPQTSWSLPRPEQVVPALYLCPTPIGNLGDVTLRTLWVLSRVQLVLAEDTRRAGILCKAYGLAPLRLVSYHRFNEAERIAMVLASLRAGESVALISDAGTPLVADPGERLVRAVLAEGERVIPLPGAQAVWPALTASGLPVLPAHHEGSLPRTRAARRRRLQALAGQAETLLFYESPQRVLATLQDMREVFGDRPACLARELTKRHETFWRGSLSELEKRLKGEAPRGEVVLVVGGGGAGRGEAESLSAWVDAMLAQGLSSRDIRKKARSAGHPGNQAYLLAEAGRDREA